MYVNKFCIVYDFTGVLSIPSMQLNDGCQDETLPLVCPENPGVFLLPGRHLENYVIAMFTLMHAQYYQVLNDIIFDKHPQGLNY